MNFFRNIIFIIFFSFISIFIVTSIIFYLFPINIYLKDSLENYVKDKSNYNLEINDLQFSLTNGILLNDISIANNDDIVFNSDNIILSINYYSLIYKKLNFKKIFM